MTTLNINKDQIPDLDGKVAIVTGKPFIFHGRNEFEAAGNMSTDETTATQGAPRESGSQR